LKGSMSRHVVQNKKDLFVGQVSRSPQENEGVGSLRTCGMFHFPGILCHDRVSHAGKPAYGEQELPSAIGRVVPQQRR